MFFYKGIFKLFYLYFFFALIAFAGVIEKEVTFNKDDISFTEIKGYDFIRLEGCGPTTEEIGAPCLPRAAFSVLIPQDAEVIDVKLISVDKEEIIGEYDIYPTQPPRPILKDKAFPFVEPSEDIYAQNTPYPGKIIESGHTGSMGGYRLASVLVYPMHYIPPEKKLVLYSRIRFKITYEEKVRPLKTKTDKQNKIFKERVKKLILNPEDIGMFEPPLGLHGSLALPPDTVEYVIITTDSFKTAFQELADWKTKKGIPAKVITLDSIYANYTGVDDADRVRNFIKDANSSWGTIWVLLGGQCDYEWDQEIVPRRDVWYLNSSSDYYPDEDTIPSDLYFSDLDGDWNADGDGVYGESADSVDLYSDVFVGRAPSRTVTQAETFVNKVLTYEKNPPFGYQKKILLATAILWDDYDETVYQEVIANMVPSDWQVSRLYERYGTLTRESFIDSVQSGFGFAHLVAHGNATGVAGYCNSDDLDTLGSDGLLGIHNSIACFVGAIDYVEDGDCFAEHYLTSTTGGGFSIMNSRYGYPSTSAYIDTCFYHEIFKEDHLYHDHLGVAHAFSKDGLIPGIWWSGNEPMCIYELNLFGDPELPLWTDIPGELIVIHNPVIPVDASTFTVNVTDGTFSVENALVCLYKEGEVYGRGYTDVSGNITLTLSPLSSPGTMYCTVTKNNYLPYEGSVDVISTFAPWVVFDHYAITDASGDDDGKVDPGESIELGLTVRNVCHDTAFAVTGILRTANAYITITDSTDEFGDVLPDSLSEDSENFDFDVALVCPADNVINFELVVRDIKDSTWISSFAIPIKTPDIVLSTDTLNYDLVFTGYADTLELLTENNGRDTLTVSSITSDNGNYSVDIENFSLLPDENQIVKVVFAPGSVGVSTGNLAIQSNDLNESVLTVFLKGEGLEPPDISVSPNYLSDTLYTGGTFTRTLTIYNTGLSDLYLQMNTVSKGYSMYLLTLPDKNPQVSDETELTNTNLPPIRTTQTQALLSDLTNVKILYDISHGQFSSAYWSTIIAVLALRGATVVVNSSEITSGLLNEYDLLWVTDLWQQDIDEDFSSSEIAAIQSWVLSGGSLLLEGDLIHPWGGYNALLQALEAGIEYSSISGSDGITTNIYPHETTIDVDSIFLYSNRASILTTTASASLIDDIDGVPNTAYSIVDRGKVLATAGELFSNHHIGYRDNQLFANQVFDWLVSGADWLSLTTNCDTIPAGDSVLVDVVFDATGLNGGDYFADITIGSNNPDEPEVIVPAHLHVLADGIEEKEIPEIFFVNQNYPNPFSSQTVIGFGCPEKAKVCIQVFDIMGRMVTTLVNKEMEADYYEVRWNGNNKFGEKLANSVYFYRMQTDKGFVATKKMILLR